MQTESRLVRALLIVVTAVIVFGLIASAVASPITV